MKLQILSVLFVSLVCSFSSADDLRTLDLVAKIGPNKVICTNYIVGDFQLNYFLHKNNSIEGGLEIKDIQVKLLYSKAYRDHGESVLLKTTNVRLVNSDRSGFENPVRNKYYLDISFDQTQVIAKIPYIGMSAGLKRINVGGVVGYQGNNRTTTFNSAIQQVEVPAHEDSAYNQVFVLQCELEN